MRHGGKRENGMTATQCEAMMYASVYPSDGGDATSLIKAVSKLSINDGALSYEPEKSTALGSGLRMVG